MTTAIIYHYFELNETYKENLIFFLNTAISNQAEYFIYISGECSVTLPKFSNVHYFFIENKSNDYGGVAKFHQDHKSRSFESYLVINASMRGPFLPTYYNGHWYEIFTSRLSKTIAVVGSSINLLPLDAFHSKRFGQKFNYPPPFTCVQTTAYALSSDAYNILASKGFFDITKALSKSDVIRDYEILLSQIIVNSGLSISSLLPTYEAFDAEHKGVKFPGTLKTGDPLYKSAFYGRSLSPLECVFIKINRDLISPRELCSYTFTALESYYKKGLLNEDGLQLIHKMSQKLLKEEPFRLTFEQLTSVLKNIKQNHPNAAEALKKIL